MQTIEAGFDSEVTDKYNQQRNIHTTRYKRSLLLQGPSHPRNSAAFSDRAHVRNNVRKLSEHTAWCSWQMCRFYVQHKATCKYIRDNSQFTLVHSRSFTCTCHYTTNAHTATHSSYYLSTLSVWSSRTRTHETEGFTLLLVMLLWYFRFTYLIWSHKCIHVET